MTAMTRLGDELDSRTYNRLIVDAVSAVLSDFAPRALCTSEVQRAFRPQNCQRVYNALRKLENRRQITHWHEIDRSWWAAERFPCSSCDWPAERVRVRQIQLDGKWQPQAFYSCSRRLHLECPLGGYTWRPTLAAFYGPDQLALADGFVA
jgi:hypothetical protein